MASRRFWRPALAVFVTGLLFTACATEKGIEAPEVLPDETVELPEFIPGPERVTAPLLGKFVDSDSISGPSFAAKIDNHTNARPQFGLQQADIVFEELVEGGITRYVGVWFSDIPNRVGPVRSIRPMDPDIVSPFGGLVTYSGGKARFVRMMQDTPVKNLIHGHGNASTIYRIPNRFAPHNVVADAKELAKQNGDLASPVQQYGYSANFSDATAQVAGKKHDKIRIIFSNARFPLWEYHADEARYYRFQEGRKDYDASENQLTATNVVTAQVKIEYIGNVPRTILTGEGKAWIATGGKHIEGKWIKKSKTDPMRFVDNNGMTVRLAPGNTWIELIPTQGSIKFE